MSRDPGVGFVNTSNPMATQQLLNPEKFSGMDVGGVNVGTEAHMIVT